MTQSEYFEKNSISFAKAMKLFNKQKNKKGGTKSFDKFLASEHVEYKFKIGDLIVLQLNKETRSMGWRHNVVFKVVEYIHDNYNVKYITPGNYTPIGDKRILPISFAEDNCVLY